MASLVSAEEKNEAYESLLFEKQQQIDYSEKELLNKSNQVKDEIWKKNESENKRKVLEAKFKIAQEQTIEYDAKKAELQNRINQQENEIKLMKNQLRFLKKGHSEYEEKKS